jgi:hypothetical protein
MIKIKAYTFEFGLVTSKEMHSKGQVGRAIRELVSICRVKKIYVTNGKKSKEIHLSKTTWNTRPIYYLRSDGVKVYTPPIRVEKYPIICVFSDGFRYQV